MIFSDIMEVIPITVVFSHVAVLGNVAPCVVVSQTAVAAN
jgi:hypothetical protein